MSMVKSLVVVFALVVVTQAQMTAEEQQKAWAEYFCKMGFQQHCEQQDNGCENAKASCLEKCGSMDNMDFQCDDTNGFSSACSCAGTASQQSEDNLVPELEEEGSNASQTPYPFVRTSSILGGSFSGASSSASASASGSGFASASASASSSSLNNACKGKDPMDVCYLPWYAGPCRGYLSRYFYNQDTEQCERKSYGGCMGNYNNFETKEKCESCCSFYK